MYELRRANLAHIKTVLDDVSEVTETELLRIGLTLWDALKAGQVFLSEGYAETLLDDGKAICILGAIPRDLGVYTWFMASKTYFEKRSAVNYSRKYMRKMPGMYPNVDIISESWSPHKARDRWFKLLGFEKVSDNGTYATFLYPRQSVIVPNGDALGPELAPPAD